MDATWSVWIAIVLLNGVDAGQQEVCSTNVSFYPSELAIAYMDREQTFRFDFPASCSDRPQLFLFSRAPTLAVVLDNAPWISINRTNTSAEECIAEGNFTVRFDIIGKTHVDVYMVCNVDSFQLDAERGVTLQDLRDVFNQSLIQLNQTFELKVIRKESILDYIFIGLIYFFVVAATIAMGMTVDLVVVVEVLKRPIAPVIGFISQYTIMPLVAFGLAKIIGFSNNVGFALFVAGCCPGGGFSNVWTYLFKGDVSLSVAMTLVSTVASLVMLPFWIYTLGQVFIDETFNVQIPFDRIFLTLLTIVIPVAIGIFFQKYFPKISKWYLKIIKPVFVIIFLLFFTAGIYINLYLFRLVTAAGVATGCFLPLLGFVLGGMFAWICRQSKQRVITIAIETGIQNYGIAIILMKFSLPPPDGDISVLPPIMASMFTPAPLLVAYVVFVIHTRFFKKPEQQVLDDAIEIGEQDEDNAENEATVPRNEHMEKRRMLQEDEA